MAATIAALGWAPRVRADFHSNLPLLDEDPDQSIRLDQACPQPCSSDAERDIPPWFWAWLRGFWREHGVLERDAQRADQGTER